VQASPASKHTELAILTAVDASQSAAPTLTSWTTLIWLVVRVPVLSEQMTVVQPSVSTDGSFRTIALRFAIFLQPVQQSNAQRLHLDRLQLLLYGSLHMPLDDCLAVFRDGLAAKESCHHRHHKKAVALHAANMPIDIFKACIMVQWHRHLAV